jgi:hypothetical protein
MKYESKEDDMVKLPDDIEKVIEVCRNDTNYMDKVVAEEREIYTKYFKSVLGEVKPEDVAVVDVGYAGTIQYYLIKLCKGNIKGYYLATEYNIKPEKVGGECYSIYSFGKDKVFEYAQLFLEAVTAAPHGQVIRMKEQDGKFEPVMKDENETCYIAAKYMQEEIYKYIRTMGKILGDTKTKFDKNLAADILAEILRPNILSSTMQDVFTVHDNYCKGDGEWKFDSENNEWVLSD